MFRSPHRRRAGLALVVGLVACAFAAGPPAQANRDGPSAHASATTPPDCASATQAVARARAALKRAKQAQKRARTPGAKRKAAKKVKKAKKALATALAARENACAQANTAPPPTTTNSPPPPTTTTNNPPPPTNNPPPPVVVNQLPFWPPQVTQVQTQNQYVIVLGQVKLSAQTLIITLSPGASDPDGDPLTYSWSASNGNINGNGLTATWERVVTNYVPVPAQVTVTASDGKGGTAERVMQF